MCAIYEATHIPVGRESNWYELIINLNAFGNNKKIPS